MTTLDKFVFLALSVALPVIVIIGGMDCPNTLAGTVSRFFFSAH